MPPAPTPRASLERRLPILIGGLLLGVFVLTAAFSYGAVKNAALSAGRERLHSVTTRLGTALGGNTANTERTVLSGANDSTVVRLMRTSDARYRDSAFAVLRRARGNTPTLIANEIWNSRRQLVASSKPGAPVPHADISAELAAAALSPRKFTVGRFRLEGDTLTFPIVAAASGTDVESPAGYFVSWSRVASTTQGRRNFLDLIGENAQLYFGNDSVWSDLTRRVPPPPSEVLTDTAVRQYTRADGQRVLGNAARVADRPWMVVVEFDEATVLAPVGNYLRNASIMGALIVAFGLILAWRLSRSITQPIARLGDSASGIAQGDFTRLADASRNDELGALGEAFNTMADRVRNTQTVLEERVRERTRKLEERNEELEAFAYTVAHDLRSPIRAMHGFSDALLQDFGDVLGYRGRDYAKRVVDAARRMDSLVRDLLEYSQIARGEIDLTPVELSGVVKNAIASEDAEIRSTGAQVTVDSPLPVVLAHDATLSQAVMNLVGNALKFVPPGKKPMVHISAERREKWTRLWVIDNGLGIAPEQHDMIFRVFERLHRREDYPGTGIGLAIVRKGVERMGGRSGVESAPGSGSRFWIELQTAGSGA
jgi:signal transduction histidine kinase